jgi:hypothetical protein
MSLPDIDIYEIRQHHGSQADAFEELCCQLANDEPLEDRVRFDRKGRGGDAGVECFATLANGSEVGWQVKFYSNFDSMIGSIDKSLTTALAKHPDMKRFIACFPFDLSDSRKKDVKTALLKWNTWKDGRIKDAAAVGRTITIDRWDAHEIKLRLTESNARSAGRIAFWFDKEILTVKWLRKTFNRVVESLGERYSPESHIDLPVRRTILATLRDPAAFGELQAFASRIATPLERAPAECDEGAIAAALAASESLRQAGMARPEPFPILDLIELVNQAIHLASSWRENLEFNRNTKNERDVGMAAVSELVLALRATVRELRSHRWQHVDTRSLLVLGEAGTGKSHLLADACAHQLAQGRPALMILGGKLPDAEPWGEILRDLDLPNHMQVKHFLGALNAAGEAEGVRTLVAIDALNEKNGQSIWPTRLSGLLSDLREFPWITVVLSCRSTYADVVIPSSLDERKLSRIEHEGFSDADVLRYLAKRGISVPETPRQLDELRNPLFLRLTCSALAFEGEVLMPDSLVGISAALELFTNAVSKRVEATLGVAPARKVVRKAIAALAEEMANTGRGQVGYSRADELMRLIHDGQEMSRDLLFQLANEGLLAVEPDHFSVSGFEEIVRFAFERVGDHAIAANLLDRSAPDGTFLCTPGSALDLALSDAGSMIVPGLLEALAVQLPERFEIELPDLESLPSDELAKGAFATSLLTRRASAFCSRTWELVEETGDSFLQYETLIALASEPSHPFNVRYLDAELRSVGMPERDASWTAHLAFSNRADELVSWAWNAKQSKIKSDRAQLAAIQLAWFLTATHRPLRDRATKALVALLADRPELAVELWGRFTHVDDGYVTERLVASLYGAAMQGRWKPSALTAVAQVLYEDLFADRSPPANVLLRDHAIGLISYAQLHGEARCSIDPRYLEPPFKSPWPIDHVSDDTIGTFTRSYGENGRWRDEIVGSCIDGDFGRYVLDYAVQDWSPAPIGTAELPTAGDLREEWFSEFSAVATAEMRAAYQNLIEAINREGSHDTSHDGGKRDRIKEAKAAFRSVVGSDLFEDWREKAEHWRADGMYQRMANRGPAEFNLAWARRWVAMRAHDLGWKEELHGDFDRGIRSDRGTHTLERIGKKYQWLALYELVARMGDNLARLPGRDEDKLRLRNIDPSLLVTRTSDNGWREFKQHAFWTGTPPVLSADTPETAISWLHSDDDILDGIDVIEVASPDDHRDWLVLAGFESWRAPVQRIRTESWRRVSCIAVRFSELGRAIEILSGMHLTSDHDLPAAEGGGYGIHLGEFPWRTLDDDHRDWIDEWRPFGRPGPSDTTISVLPTTAEYSAEASGYDGSISENIYLSLPACWIMNGLGLRLTDGQSILYRDAADLVRFWDPSVSKVGRSAGLIDRSAFLGLLEREGLVAIWAVAGEKNAYGDGSGEGFGGRFTFTRLYHSEGREIRAMTRFESYDEPDESQLAEFLGRGPAASN